MRAPLEILLQPERRLLRIETDRVRARPGDEERVAPVGELVGLERRDDARGQPGRRRDLVDRKLAQHPTLPQIGPEAQGAPISLRNFAHSAATGLSFSSFTTAHRSNSALACAAFDCRASTFPDCKWASGTSGHSSA